VANPISLNKHAGVSVRDQLVAQLEMQILSGAVTAGTRLPSVRALARRLAVHANTVSAAYRELQKVGHVERRQGSGVYVRSHGPRTLEDATGLDEMIRMALQAAFRRGFQAEEIRSAVARWLSASSVDRVLVVDVEREMADLLVHELASVIETPVQGITIDELTADPQRAAGAVLAAHRYHVGRIARRLAGVPIVALNIQALDVRDAVRKLPAGSLIVVVSHSAALLPIATVLLHTMRDGDITVEGRVRTDTRDWRPLVRGSEFVLADMLSFPAVRTFSPRRVTEFRIIAPESIERLRTALALGHGAMPSPVGAAPTEGRTKPKR
jgi:DNA-binding transcriptional regulator YhcF (GntR family)